jgi:hypothetical protein
LASIPILLAAGILTPPIYERLRSLFKFDLDVQLKVVASLVLFVAYLVMYGIGTSNEASEQRRIAVQQAEQARQSERDETIRYLQANKQQIQANAYQLLDQGKVTEAFDAVRKFRGLGDSDIEAVIAKVEAKSKAIADEAKKAKLIESLATIKSDNISERARIYEQLSALAPGNAEYKKMAADLKAQLAQAAIKKKAEADAAAAKAYQREMGLVWRYDSYKDEMTQKPILNAQVDSVSTLSFDFPYSGSQRATLQLRKHPRWGSDVILQIQRGQFLCNSYDGCSVYVRFGNGAPQRFSASQPSDNSTTYLFISGYSNFVSQLRKVDEVVIEASFYQAGNQAMKFSTADLNWN